jgi:hypothetical protein
MDGLPVQHGLAVRGRWGRLSRAAPGQGVVELALLLPMLAVLVLGAVDFAQVLSVQQRLGHAAHLATVALLAHPDQHAPASLSADVEAESGLSPVSATAAYTTAVDGSDEVVVTADYSYTLLMPGLRDIQTGTISGGRLRVSVAASGVAATDSPTLVEDSPVITVTPPTAGMDPTVPPSLALTCVLFKDGAPVAQSTCAARAPLVWTNPSPGGSHTYVAVVRQVNGVSSPASVTVSGP